jgi:hypothetical protein
MELVNILGTQYMQNKNGTLRPVVKVYCLNILKTKIYNKEQCCFNVSFMQKNHK